MLYGSKNGIKAFSVVCLISLLISIPDHLRAQNLCDIPITVKFTDQTLEHVLDSLSAISNLRFSYNSEIIPKEVPVSLSFSNISICSILDSLFTQFKLKWTRVENQIVITPLLKENEPKIAKNDIPSFIELTGKIQDADDHQPVPYAYLRIIGKTVGTITNEDGEFVFKYYPDNDRDIIAISSIGYKTLSFPITDLINGRTFQLQREPILLKEVLIRSYDPKSIIRKSIQAISSNYSNTASMETGFYRETLKKNNHYVLLSEAIVNIYKSSYNNPYQRDQIKVFKGRKTADQRQYDTILFKVQGGIFNCLMLDIVKNLPSFLEESDFGLYDYKMGIVQKVNNEMAYSIEFDQKDGIEDPYYKGRLLVEVNSLTILGAEFSISPKAIGNAASLLVKKAPHFIKVKPVSVNYIVNFANENGKWQLNHIRMELQVRIRKRSNLFNSLYTSVSEMVITETDTIPAKSFRNSEIARSNEVFIDHLGQYDPGFWGKYNYIKPEEELEETLKTLFPKNTN
jgi:hypothetical protein